MGSSVVKGRIFKEGREVIKVYEWRWGKQVIRRKLKLISSFGCSSQMDHLLLFSPLKLPFSYRLLSRNRISNQHKKMFCFPRKGKKTEKLTTAAMF